MSKSNYTAEQMRRYREQNPDKVAADSARRKARGRALNRLALKYPHDFHTFMKEELRNAATESRQGTR